MEQQNAAIKYTSTSFFDGYMKAHISENAGRLSIHKTQIGSLLLDAIGKFDLQNTGEKGTSLHEAITRFLGKEYSGEYYEYCLCIAELIARVHFIGFENMPAHSQILMKRVVFHFLNIAKILQDQRIIDMATKAAINLL